MSSITVFSPSVSLISLQPLLHQQSHLYKLDSNQQHTIPVPISKASIPLSSSITYIQFPKSLAGPRASTLAHKVSQGTAPHLCVF